MLGILVLGPTLGFVSSLDAGDRTLGSAPDPGILKTKVKPDDVGVWVDGKYAGHTDRFSGPGEHLYLPPGRHEVRFTLAFFEDYTTTVDIQAGVKTFIRHRMEPSSEKPPDGPFGKVKIQPPTAELNAAVLVDGRQIGYADQVNKIAQTLLLETGEHKIELHYAGYRPYETTVHIEADKKYVITPSLTPE
jgi:hypothetical protein